MAPQEFLCLYYASCTIKSPLEGLVWIKHFNAEDLFYVLVSIAVKAKYKASFVQLFSETEIFYEKTYLQLQGLWKRSNENLRIVCEWILILNSFASIKH